MLQMVVDLKNNKRAVGADAGGAGGREGEDQWGFPITLSRALKADAGVGDASVALRTLTYDKLSKDKASLRGQWWLPEAAGTEAWFAARKLRAPPNAAPGGGGVGGGARGGRGCGAPAQGQGHAHEHREPARGVLRCDGRGGLRRRAGRLRAAAARRGEQRREIPRVLLECCLNGDGVQPVLRDAGDEAVRAFAENV